MWGVRLHWLVLLLITSPGPIRQDYTKGKLLELIQMTTFLKELTSSKSQITTIIYVMADWPPIGILWMEKKNTGFPETLVTLPSSDWDFTGLAMNSLKKIIDPITLQNIKMPSGESKIGSPFIIANDDLAKFQGWCQKIIDTKIATRMPLYSSLHIFCSRHFYKEQWHSF